MSWENNEERLLDNIMLFATELLFSAQKDWLYILPVYKPITLTKGTELRSTGEMEKLFKKLAVDNRILKNYFLGFN